MQSSKRKRCPENAGAAPSSPPPPSKHPRCESDTKNQEIDLEDSDDDDDYGPTAPTEPRPAAGPSLTPSNHDEIDINSDSDSDVGPAPPKPAVGPTPPPPAEATSQTNLDSSDSDSDDDYGPAPPGASNAPKRSIGPQLPAAAPKQERDSWMLAPPTSSAYTERDPTRMRNRKFASKPASSTGPSAISSIWTETPEEKLKRLQDAVLGREDKTKEATPNSKRSEEEEERQRKIAANIEAQRGQSLYDEHQSKRDKGGAKVEEEDDPSKRGFDREKDMALGGKIGTSQRRELMNKAANFGGRFQKGSFL